MIVFLFAIIFLPLCRHTQNHYDALGTPSEGGAGAPYY